MAKINILPAKVYNRIAAGEVVDRPYSVVKELVENAIDAGATEIEIFIENGGKQLIEVIDNGCGIERDDLHSAFMPHATSKIAVAEDLERIATLGFRGEAVASIASVSNMTITSKVKDGKCYSLTCEGGEIGRVTQSSGDDGTDVRVERLFFNTPVRYAFLKSDKAEEADITTFVSRFILSRADIAFTYYVNGKKVLQSFGGGDEEAFLCVYGATALSNCYKIDADKHGIKIRGYIGNQNFSKANKSYQSVFLNGRYILNNTVATAISSAYASYLMKRQYPFYVLHIDVPTEIVDVNVHPNKADVRFADNKIIFGCIHSVVAAVLDGNSKALDYVVAPTEKQEEPKTSAVQMDAAIIEEYNREFAKKSFYDEPQQTLSDSILQQAQQEEQSLKQKRDEFSSFTYEQAQEELKAHTEAMRKIPAAPTDMKGYYPIEDIPDVNPDDLVKVSYREMEDRRPKRKNPERLHKKFPDTYFERTFLRFDDPAYEEAKNSGKEEDFFAANKRFLEEQEQKAKQNRIDVKSCVYAGKLFNTYLLYENGENIYIIDQHAAHERLIFDKLKAKMQNRSIVKQEMLLPYDLRVNAFEAAFVADKIEEIRSLGFDIEQRGETLFCVTAVPADLQNINLHTFFNSILAEINTYRAIKLEDILKDKLASAACKAAVKGGMDLTRAEVESLLVQMDGDMGLKCPHGRPVVVKMTRMQLEKMFKRIV